MDLNRRPRQRGRKWEDLDPDCLANVFMRVGMETLLLFVPLVCKSWYRASLNPLCWECIVLPDDYHFTDPLSLDDKVINLPWTYYNHIEGRRFDYFMRRFAREFHIEWRYFSVPKFFKLVLNRSCGNAKFLKIPGLCSHYMNAVEAILEHISINCKNFVGLHLTDASIGRNEASAIAKFLPHLKLLSLRQSCIEKSDLLMVLRECKGLVMLDVRECKEIDAKDEDIVKLTSHIPKFLSGGSKTLDLRENAVEIIEIDDDDD